MDTETYKGQRNKEKYNLFKRFRFKIIQDLYKKKLIELFGNRCFKCGTHERDSKTSGKPPILCMDHHIPMVLGGHLEPGNIVILCRRCNNAKHNKAPEEFYSQEELSRLNPILDKQIKLFDFEFDWGRWNSDRERYLIDLGVDPFLVHEVLHNQDHHNYIGLPCESKKMVISITFD